MPLRPAEEMFDLVLRENVPVGGFTTLGIGGPARFFAAMSSVESLAVGAAWAKSRDLLLFVLAGGSNIVVSDSGFPGLVLRIDIRGVESRVEGDVVFVTAGAGEEWDGLVETCVANGWAGFECLSGIPGRVGATPIQNVGAYGQEISESFVSLEALDTQTGAVIRLSRDDCEFGYRASRFRNRDRGRFIIARVTYRLASGGAPSVRYAELKQYLEVERQLSAPGLADVRRAVLAIRRQKSMVIDSADPDSRSVGSFFTNPVVSGAEFVQVEKNVLRLASKSDLPSFPTTEGLVKLSAAWLIEQSGFHRGYIRGGVGISSKHALAIINRGGGTAREVMELSEAIKLRVFEKFGVALSAEPVFVGFR